MVLLREAGSQGRNGLDTSDNIASFSEASPDGLLEGGVALVSLEDALPHVLGYLETG